MILNEKEWDILPPPPYSSQVSDSGLGPHSHQNPRSTGWRGLSSLPTDLLLQIIDITITSSVEVSTGSNGRDVFRTLYWIANSLRLVNRNFYLASMNILRSIHLPMYERRIKHPYTSEPFPRTSLTSDDYRSSIISNQEESKILDLFILVLLKEKVYMDDSTLHLQNEDIFKDIFDFMQPRARLLDLVRNNAEGAGLSSLYESQSESQSSLLNSQHTTIEPSSLSVTFSPRTVVLTIFASGRRRTITSLPRERSESLENCARRLVTGLKKWIYSQN